MTSNKAKSRLNLELPDKERGRLERLRDATNAASMSEVVQRALELYGIVVDANGEVIVVEGDKTRRHIKFIF